MRRNFAPFLLAIGAASVTACSSPPSDGAAGVKSPDTDGTTAEGAPDAGACDPTTPCAPGYYCAPADGASCGPGTCQASPQACPMFDLPVCGCDGNSYMNACWATRGPNGGTGTTSAGSLFATFQLSDLVGVWHSKGAGAVDTLRLGADDSYELVEVEEPDAGTTDSGPCETTKTSSGTFAMSTYGITLTPDAPSNAQSMPTEFYVENTCPLGGPLQLTSAVLPGATVLVRQR